MSNSVIESVKPSVFIEACRGGLPPKAMYELLKDCSDEFILSHGESIAAPPFTYAFDDACSLEICRAFFDRFRHKNVAFEGGNSFVMHMMEKCNNSEKCIDIVKQLTMEEKMFQNQRGVNVLMKALEYHQSIEVLEAILENTPQSYFTVRNLDGHSAIRIAIEFDNPNDVIQMLLKKMSADTKMKQGDTLSNHIYKTRYVLHVEVMKALVEGTSVEWRTSPLEGSDTTPLILAVFHKAPGEVIQVLIEGLSDEYLERTATIDEADTNFFAFKRNCYSFHYCKSNWVGRSASALKIALQKNISAAAVLISQIRPEYLYRIPNDGVTYLMDIASHVEEFEKYVNVFKNAPPHYLASKDKSTGETVLDILIKYVDCGDDFVLEIISRFPKDELYAIDNDNDSTYLTSAIRFDWVGVEIIKALVKDAPREWIEYESKKHGTALMALLSRNGDEYIEVIRDVIHLMSDEELFKVLVGQFKVLVGQSKVHVGQFTYENAPNTTYLLEAASRGKFEIIPALLERDPPVEWLTYRLEDKTALLILLNARVTQFLDQSILALISKYPEEDLQDHIAGTTYLLEAIEKCDLSIINVLMRHASAKSLEFRDKTGSTALANLLKRCLLERTDVILKCIDKLSSAHLHSYRCKGVSRQNDTTYLMLAAKSCCDINVFKALLKNAPSEWIAARRSHQLILSMAVAVVLNRKDAGSECMIDVAIAIIEHMNKSDVHSSIRGETLLQIAAKSKCDYRVIDALVKDAPDTWINTRSYNRTILELALMHDAPAKTLERIIDLIPKEELYSTSFTDGTHLMIAAINGHIEGVRLLLKDAPYDWIVRQNKNGDTFLHKLMTSNSILLYDIWDSLNASVKSISNHAGWTAAMIPLKRFNKSNCLKFLRCNNGMEINGKLLERGVNKCCMKCMIPPLMNEQVVQLMWVLDTSLELDKENPLTDENVYDAMSWCGVSYRRGPLSDDYFTNLEFSDYDHDHYNYEYDYDRYDDYQYEYDVGYDIHEYEYDDNRYIDYDYDDFDYY
eukprot:TRINITY_DN2443_c0_g1_i3.p1 TRINITY_DN2443_c0_g1~~TRINITY_DN2443_c0_g1_i3.p1  ORF type:complete len:1109 (+),score=216.15 TRINITY_DN2443_c0_g1_i3:266-3328(+)